VLVAVDVVGLDAVAAARLRQVQPRGHDGAHVGRARVDPLLAGPAVERVAEVGRLELRVVGPPVLGAAGREVAHDVAARVVQGRDDAVGRVEQVDVVDVDVVLRVDGAGELPLPGVGDLGRPRRDGGGGPPRVGAVLQRVHALGGGLGSLAAAG